MQRIFFWYGFYVKGQRWIWCSGRIFESKNVVVARRREVKRGQVDMQVNVRTGNRVTRRSRNITTGHICSSVLQDVVMQSTKKKVRYFYLSLISKSAIKHNTHKSQFTQTKYHIVKNQIERTLFPIVCRMYNA